MPRTYEETTRAPRRARADRALSELLNLALIGQLGARSDERPEVAALALLVEFLDAVAAGDDPVGDPHRARSRRLREFLDYGVKLEGLRGWLLAAEYHSGASALDFAVKNLLEQAAADDRRAEALGAAMSARGLRTNHDPENVSVAIAAHLHAGGLDDDLAADAGLLVREHFGFLQSMQRSANALRALLDAVRRDAVRVVAVSAFEPTMTAKAAGKVLFPGEHLSTQNVCDRIRGTRAPPELRVFCTGGPGRAGKHFIARVVHEVAASARPVLDRITRHAAEKRERTAAEAARASYQAGVARRLGSR